MPLQIRGQTDAYLDAVMQVLSKYEFQHTGAAVEAYRQNSAAIRIRIIDPDFAGISRADRHEKVWRFLEELPEDVQSQVSVLLLLTPEEKEKSFASFDFDEPIPSGL